jgi:7-carboxy-7-deazaguanine synthase
MSYSVKEIFYTLQGEGANAGRPAVFCRFAGCNLWTGREDDRANAICKFCDTDFVGTNGTAGGKYQTPLDLAREISGHWPQSQREPAFVVFTGGEPLLQLDEPLIDALHQEGFVIAVETNGTVLPPKGIDWLCVSPKAGSQWVVKTGHELKVVWPQKGWALSDFDDTEFAVRYLQPMDDLHKAQNTQACIDQCLRDPQWRLSIQTHKITGIR